MTSFDEEIAKVRQKLGPRSQTLVEQGIDIDDGPAVQLSVRIPEGLRSAVAATAAAKNQTVTAFVDLALRRAVSVANDTFAGMAADMLDNLRRELAEAVANGEYAEAAQAVDRAEAEAEAEAAEAAWS